ncbi:MAG: hypothetical protein IPH98_15090 [Saprospiraceae bacterium]|nr:hypothetical protein [Candidatus Defluviibacterium haderslevense]
MLQADTNGLQIMHDKRCKTYGEFKDVPDQPIKKINAPTLIIVGDRDVINPEHALELHE